MMLQPLIYALIFLGILCMVEGAYLAIYGKTLRRERKVNRRLALMQQGRDTQEVMAILRKERENGASRARQPVIGPLLDQARNANIGVTPPGMLLALVGAILVAFLALTFFTGAGLQVRLLVALVLGYSTLYLWFSNKAKKRLALFEEQLPDALDLIVRSLRVGHPMNAAVAVVARELPDPLGTEMGLIADEATYGMNVNDALERMARRVPVPDLRFLAVAVNIQAASGGNLAEILEGLAKVIRARFKLFRKVRAITAEARWSGWFLSIFPVLALILVQIIQPDYYDRVADHPLFLPGAIVTVVLLALNIVFMRALVNIKV